MATPRSLIAQAFEDLRVLAPGGAVSSTVEADAFVYLNQLLSSLSTEGAMAFNQVRQTFNLQSSVVAYTLGSGGAFATTGGLRAVKVTSWRASYAGVLSNGGAPLSMADFGAQARQMIGESSAIPAILGADTAYPLINVRIHPPPSLTPGTIEIGYWTPITQFATVTDTVSLPEGWEQLLHYNLALALFPQYGRQGGVDPVLAANAQNSKASIVAQNAMGAPPAAQ